MNAGGKSDESIVPAKQTNKDRTGRSAESVEESDSIKRNAHQTALPRTPSRIKRKSRGLHGVREDLEGNWVDPGESIFIGGGDDANHFGNGIWDEFKFYDTALTPGEVLFLFSEIESACDPNSNGDLDGNGTVEFADFLVLSQNFGQRVGSHAEGDIDCNGTVEFSDFLVLSNNFGNQVNRTQLVPEPTGFILLAVATLIGGRARRRRYHGIARSRR